MTKVEIFGRSVNVRMSMATLIAYEELAGEPLNFGGMTSAKSQYSLCVAAITSAKQETPLEDDFFDRLLNDATIDEIAALNEAVAQEAAIFYKIPNVIKGEEKEKEKEKDANP